MRRRHQRPAATLAMILAGVVAFALVNPFCCHLLPIFEGEPAPGEWVVDEAQSPCPGKPEALPEDALVSPDFVVVVADLPPPVLNLSAAQTTRWIKVRNHARAGPPRLVWFGVLLI